MNISHIPPTPWIYLFKDRKQAIIYIGKAKNLAKRVSQYFTPWSVWKQDMLTKADRVDYIEVTTESEALFLEDNLIKKHNPEYNRLLKWDNSYVYLRITRDDFPQISITRQRKNDGCTYIWPKNNTGDLKKLMHYLRQIYKFRTMKTTLFRQGKLDADFFFGLDKWWSVIAKLKWFDLHSSHYQNIANEYHKSWLIIDQSYDDYVNEYKKIVQSVIQFFGGNTKEVRQTIQHDIQTAIAKEHFERCAILRDILSHIEQRTEKQHVVLSPKYSGKIIRIIQTDKSRIIIMVVLYEGKMTDVIREKKLIEEWSLSQIISSIEADFGIMHKTEDWHTTTLISQSMKKIARKEWTEVDNLLQKFTDSYIASTSFDDDAIINDLLSELQSRYHLPRLPYHIECIDISHLAGRRVSGGLSCMIGWLLTKKYYRKYKIKLLADNKTNNPDDYLSLQEIIVRRFNLKSNMQNPEFLPDLFILDWWKGQLWILRELCTIFPWLREIMQTTTFIALWKWKARKESAKSKGEKEIIYSFENPPCQRGEGGICETPLLYDQADLLLLKLRDEAHRFANKYRQEQMNKEWK